MVKKQPRVPQTPDFKISRIMHRMLILEVNLRHIYPLLLYILVLSQILVILQSMIDRTGTMIIIIVIQINLHYLHNRMQQGYIFHHLQIHIIPMQLTLIRVVSDNTLAPLGLHHLNYGMLVP